MNQRIQPDELQETITALLQTYGDEVAENVNEAVKESAKDGVKALKENVASAGIGGTKYRKSFKVKTTQGRLLTSSVIYSDQYHLTHLLENGHAIIIHGKPHGTTRAFPHWAKAEETSVESLTERITKIIEG